MSSVLKVSMTTSWRVWDVDASAGPLTALLVVLTAGSALLAGCMTCDAIIEFKGNVCDNDWCRAMKRWNLFWITPCTCCTNQCPITGGSFLHVLILLARKGTAPVSFENHVATDDHCCSPHVWQCDTNTKTSLHRSRSKGVVFQSHPKAMTTDYSVLSFDPAHFKHAKAKFCSSAS